VSSAQLVITQQHFFYRRQRLIKSLILLALSVLLVVSFIWDLSSGPSSYGLLEVGACLVDCPDPKLELILWQIRMPIALIAVLVGAMLACAGAQMQTILNNPLADPFTLGISAAAAFGAALTFVLDWAVLPVAGVYIVSVNAFLFAMLSALVLFAISKMRGVGYQTLVLAGIALMFSFNALLAFLQYIASEDALQQLVFWTLGSLARASFEKVMICFVVLLSMLTFFFCYRDQLTALRFGDEQARSMGVNVNKLRLFSLLACALLASVAVAFVGTIGFVGLVAPHIARLLLGEDQRFFLPGSILVGASLLSLASVLSKLVVSGALLPIGITTSLIGIPCFFILIFTIRQK
jgi:iron complex transport system permease protein